MLKVIQGTRHCLFHGPSMTATAICPTAYIWMIGRKIVEEKSLI